MEFFFCLLCVCVFCGFSSYTTSAWEYLLDREHTATGDNRRAFAKAKKVIIFVRWKIDSGVGLA